MNEIQRPRSRKTRRLFVALIGMLSLGVAGASLAWACSGAGVGIPSTPAPPKQGQAQPPASGGGDPAPSPGTSQPGGSPAGSPNGASGAPSSAPQSAGGSTTVAGGSAERGRSVSGARGGAGGRIRSAQPGSAGVAPLPRSAPAPGSGASPKALFRARVSGATAGRARSAGKPVFRSSLPPKRAGKPSERAATGELWSGFGRPERGSAASAADASLTHGAGSGLWAAIALLGLGLAGICGSFALVAARRRAGAKAPAGGSDGAP